jgi:hypothetical protein
MDRPQWLEDLIRDPAFIAQLQAAQEDIEAGRLLTLEELKAELGIATMTLPIPARYSKGLPRPVQAVVRPKPFFDGAHTLVIGSTDISSSATFTGMLDVHGTVEIPAMADESEARAVEVEIIARSKDGEARAHAEISTTEADLGKVARSLSTAIGKDLGSARWREIDAEH